MLDGRSGSLEVAPRRRGSGSEATLTAAGLSALVYGVLDPRRPGRSRTRRYPCRRGGATARSVSAGPPVPVRHVLKAAAAPLCDKPCIANGIPHALTWRSARSSGPGPLDDPVHRRRRHPDRVQKRRPVRVDDALGVSCGAECPGRIPGADHQAGERPSRPRSPRSARMWPGAARRASTSRTRWSRRPATRA